MINTAQNVADKYGLTREEIDAFALRSQQHAAAARDNGRLAQEIQPVDDRRDTPHAGSGCSSTTRGSATTRRPRHSRRCRPQPGTTQMTAGNSSPLNDGASAVVLAERRRGGGARRRAAGPRRLVCDPRARSRSSWASRRRGRLPRRYSAPAWRPATSTSGRSTRRSRPRPSASCASCPTSSTASRSPTRSSTPTAARSRSAIRSGRRGTRYVLTLATELRERDARYGVLGVCVGSGQGVAMVLENPR